jgi:hypothetical protein
VSSRPAPAASLPPFGRVDPKGTGSRSSTSGSCTATARHALVRGERRRLAGGVMAIHRSPHRDLIRLLARCAEAVRVARLNVQRIPTEALFVAACPAARCLGESRALRRCRCGHVMGGESGAANGARKFAVAHSFQQRLGACSVARYKLLRPRSVAGKSTTRSSAGPRNRSRSTPATLFCDMEGHP